MKLNDAIEIATKAVRILEPITTKKYEYEYDGFELEQNDDPMINDIYKRAISKFKDAAWLINYANKPVKYEGYLQRNNLGRYEFDNGEYLSTGNPVEIYIPDEEQYVLTTIEHREDYYAAGYADHQLEGSKARIR